MTEPVPLEQACILGHAEPVEREFGYACKRHYHWIGRTLLQIEELYALLDDVLIPGPGGDTRSGTRVGSPAPGRLAVMAITDTRNRPLNLPMTPERNLVPSSGVLESNGDDEIDLPGTLASWARVVVEERESTDELTGDVSQSIRVLRRERGWISQQEWLDDYAADMSSAHRAVARAVGDTMWPRPVGKCPTLGCGVSLYNTIGLDEVHCRRCKRTWTGIALARLRLIHEQDQREHGAV